MKKIIIFVTILSIAYSCANKEASKVSVDSVIESGDLTKMKAKRSEVLMSYDSISKLLSKLEHAISKIDTTKKHTLVTVYKVADTTFKNYISIQGNVNTSENILIYPEYQGVLSQVYVKQGQKVSKGQTLARINDGGLSSQLAQLEAQSQLAKTTYDRQERLWQQKIGSEIQYLQAKTSMESSQSAVKQLRAQLSKTIITAPFSGVIDDIITEQGQVVVPGMQAIMRLVNLNNMHVNASIPENYIKSVVKGSSVNVTFPALGKTVEGKVKTVSSFINPSNRTFEIEVDVPNADKTIKPNLMANLEINNYSKENALVIPSDCIQENAKGEKHVFLIDETATNAKVVQTKIETGNTQGGLIEVLSGLEKDTKIVKDGALTLKDGETVTIKTTNQ
ncbi:efflux RND transporter periplasmic adaptor subunit [Mariniflexile sp. HNIBRBA6329]|uniref:efflux RND transporter periplasmic adaptor subunit n=1 Tax=Mariniflexile sp. HNIBRBA6329 TaxID=3373088 RepID=UPI003745FD0C